MSSIKNLKFEISLIHDKRIQRLVRDTFTKKVPDYFWSYPASSTGKYHPLNKNGNPESLVEHTKSVVRILSIMINHPSEKFSQYDKDILIAAALLHDSAKYGLDNHGGISNHTVHIHPVLVKYLYPYKNLESSNYKVFKDICNLIFTHHGPWRVNKYSEVVLPAPSNTKQSILHTADYLASRRIIHVDQEDSNEALTCIT